MDTIAPNLPEELHIWRKHRLAQLGYLVGLGWEAKQIAAEMATSSSNIHRQANLFGLSFRESYSEHTYGLSGMSLKFFDTAARKRNVTRAMLLRKLLTEIACDPCLLSNILDDGF